MNTLIGIDAEESYREAMALLGRIRFADNVATLAHACEPVLTPLYAAPSSTYEGAGRLEASFHEASRWLLQEALREAYAYGLGPVVETVSVDGPKARALMSLATDLGVDLVAIGSGRKGTLLETLFKGSVGRALAADCAHSFLVARSGTKRQGTLKAVFATDLTADSQRSFGRFLEMAPQGIEEVTLLTAVESGRGMGQRAAEMGESMAALARSLGFRCHFTCEEGSPKEALPAAMERVGAELLVIGAKGHKFVERLFGGSVAYHEVAAEPYSVLVVRPPAL